MTELSVATYRASLAEERHRVHVAVVDAEGRLLGSSGDPGYVTYWRSAAKPFQALAGLKRGVWDRYDWGEEELALACASHSSEDRHVELAQRMLASIGLDESHLACGPHTPLSRRVAEERRAKGVQLTSLFSNCSGKHTAMLALALHERWETNGYQHADHPVQHACLSEVSEGSGIPLPDIGIGVDGCTVACFALPVRAMAAAYCTLTDPEHPGHRPIQAMMRFPEFVAGEGRLCTELMRAYPRQIVAKVGASGVYSAGLLERRIGVAIKVEDGNRPAAEAVLLAVLDSYLDPSPSERLAEFASPVLRNSRDEPVGELRVNGSLAQQNAPPFGVRS